MNPSTYLPLSALRTLALTSTLAIASTSVLAADENSDHSAHQHDTPTATQTPVDSVAKEQDPSIRKQMHAMKAMHEKMMRARTPEERSALMADHMQTMRDGMGMMHKMGQSGGMGGASTTKERGAMACDMHESHKIMSARIDMMESMMQMMMDHMQMLTPAPSAGKQ